jgi:ribonuclease VapC
MIVVDTSAIIAIIQAEPECTTFLDHVRRADRALISAVSMLEAGMVLRARRGPAGVAELADLVEAMGIEVVPFDAALADGALAAFAVYGKGLHPQARLNLGDCATYALAKAMSAPLLFKGDDFPATDIVAAA